jgi:hypothetical protein
VYYLQTENVSDIRAVAYLRGAFGRSERRKIFVCAFVWGGRGPGGKNEEKM